MIKPEPRDSDQGRVPFAVFRFALTEAGNIDHARGQFFCQVGKGGKLRPGFTAETEGRNEKSKQNRFYPHQAYFLFGAEFPKYSKNSESGDKTKEALPSAKAFL